MKNNNNTLNQAASSRYTYDQTFVEFQGIFNCANAQDAADKCWEDFSKAFEALHDIVVVEYNVDGKYEKSWTIETTTQVVSRRYKWK